MVRATFLTRVLWRVEAVYWVGKPQGFGSETPLSLLNFNVEILRIWKQVPQCKETALPVFLGAGARVYTLKRLSPSV
jgi:hypothetical protein